MVIRPILNNDDLTAILVRIGELWGEKLNTPEGDELDVLLDLVERYEDQHFPVEQLTIRRSQSAHEPN